MKIKLLLVSVLSVFTLACDPGQPGDSAARGDEFSVKGYAAPLSDSEYDALTPTQKYQVANKLLSTLYKGVAVSDFFDISQGLDKPRLRDASNFLRDIRVRLATDLDADTKAEIDLLINGNPDAVDINGDAAPMEAKYRFSDRRPKQIPFARIFEYPLSRDFFSQWMSLHLANTILFSPAEEIDSADITDVQNLFRRLDLSIMDGAGIRSIIATHQRSVENWRRFRSPEDNTREMIEIYLGLFDRDEDVPRASQACKDLYLTDEAAGYKLAYTDYPNDAPQLVLDTYVLNCNDFYDVVASHPLVIPRVTSVLVDYFFANRSNEDRTRFVESVAASEPETFEDLFTAILFSRQYLLNTEREKSFEESFMGTAARLGWEAHPDVFYSMTTGGGSLGRTELAEMGWPSMTLKLGRLSGVPLDALSFANYHKGYRESLLMDKYRWQIPLGIGKPESPWPEPPEQLEEDADAQQQAKYREALQEYEQNLATLTAKERRIYDHELSIWNVQMDLYRAVGDLSLQDLIDYLFMSVAERRAKPSEMAGLIEIMESYGYLKIIDNERFVEPWNRDDVAKLVMDFQSRLHEIYYLKVTN